MSAIKQPFVHITDDIMADLPISTAAVLRVTEAAIRGRDAGTVWAAPKATIFPPDGRYLMAALAGQNDPPYLVTKTVVLNPANPGKGLPQIDGVISLVDAETGHPKAILDAGWITGIRTAGASAAAARHMARKDAASIGFIGAGVQAHWHLRLFSDMFPIKHIRTFSRGRAKQEALCAEAEKRGISGEICSSAEAAISDVDMIVTSITVDYSPEFRPFLDAGCLKPGAFAAVTDLGVPWIKDRLVALDRVIIDDLEQEAAMEKKLAPQDVVQGDLTGVVCGRVSGREQEQERTAFIFRGVPLGDLALSVLVYEKYREARG